MALWDTIKTVIDAAITDNDAGQITGPVLNTNLKALVDALGASQFKGVAVTSTDPGTNDGPVFYFATGDGTYTNFGSAVLSNELAVLSNMSGPWVKTQILDLSALGGGGSDTAEEIRDKLETLTVDDRLDASAIKNLPSGGASEVETDWTHLYRYTNDFSADKTGVGNFNGGSTVYDGGGSRVQVTTAGSAQGAILDYIQEFSKGHLLIVDLTLVSGGDVEILSRWGVSLGTFGTGRHEIPYTSDASGGGFGNRVTFVLGAAGSFYINNVRLLELNDNRIINRPIDTELLIATEIAKKTTLLYADDFSDDSLAYISGFGLSGIVVVGGQLQANPTSSGQILVIGYKDASNSFDIPEWVDLYLDIEIIDTEFDVLARWGNSTGINFVTTGTGQYFFRLRKVGDNATAPLNHISMASVDAGGGSIRINEIKVFKGLDFSTKDQFVEIGAGASSSNTQRGVSIGLNATSDQSRATIVGYEAKGDLDTSYGCAGGPEVLAIGEEAKAYGWRASAVGAKSHAGGQSSTALGAGAVSLSSHGVALGRGAYVGDPNHLGFNPGTVIANYDLYFENGWGHYFNTPPSTISIGNKPNPWTFEVKIHGQDAFDARYLAWDIGDTYAIGDFRQYNSKLYMALTISTAAQPDVSPSDWQFMHDISGGVPASFNQAGGDIALYGGRGTGTGEGGDVLFYTAPQAGVGQNTKNADVVVGKFDGLSTHSDGTRFYLLDVSNNTLYRVEIGANDSGGTGKRVLVIDNA